MKLDRIDAPPLDREIEIVQALIEQEFAAGRTTSCNALLTTAGRLKKMADDMSIRANRVLSQGAIIRLAQELGRITLEELESVTAIPDWQREVIVDKIFNRFAATVSQSQNTEHEKTKLLGRDH